MPQKIQPSAEKKLHKEIVKQMLTLATSGFGLVAALAWNSVILELVNTHIKPFIPGGGLISLLIYAILITTLAVTITYQLTKLMKRLEEH